MKLALRIFLVIALVPLMSGHATSADEVAPLQSWAEGQAKRSIVEFVEDVTNPDQPDFVPASERIAVFDNDGTLWVEHPIYTQLAFALDEVRRLAPQHPDWRTREPFASVLRGDLKGIAAQGEHGVLELVMATHAGMTTDAFEARVKDWMASARDPRFARLYTDLVYQPMLDLIEYLRARQFKIFIVSGGGIDFMRPWTEATYGIPPEQVIGSSIAAKFEMKADGPVIVKQPKIEFNDDGPGKPVGIQRFIGRRPILAFGNSDGDFQMLQWTTHGPGRRLGLILHHDDAVREYAYDRKTSFGRLDRGLDAAVMERWIVVSMQKDWRRVFGWE